MPWQSLRLRRRSIRLDLFGANITVSQIARPPDLRRHPRDDPGVAHRSCGRRRGAPGPRPGRRLALDRRRGRGDARGGQRPDHDRPGRAGTVCAPTPPPRSTPRRRGSSTWCWSCSWAGCSSAPSCSAPRLLRIADPPGLGRRRADRRPRCISIVAHVVDRRAIDVAGRPAASRRLRCSSPSGSSPPTTWHGTRGASPSRPSGAKPGWWAPPEADSQRSPSRSPPASEGEGRWWNPSPTTTGAADMADRTDITDAPAPGHHPTRRELVHRMRVPGAGAPGGRVVVGVTARGGR